MFTIDATLMVIFSLFTVAPPLFASWESLSPYQRGLAQSTIPAAESAWDAADARTFLQQRGTRATTYLAVGMLYRNGAYDRSNANALLREVLSLQYDAPGTRRHGVWRTGVESDRLDENWREFVGVGLIIAREWFRDSLEPGLITDIERVLTLAAEGASARDVTPQYTNIALMSSFLLDYVGHRNSNIAWIEQGTGKARAICEGFMAYHTFPEYNSPTYYGVDLMGLALWRSIGQSAEFREWGRQLERELWRDIALLYHPRLRNISGPYARAYGMDMTQYVALTGIWIALALEDDARAPIPPERTQQLYEWAYTPLFAMLGMEIPEDAMRNLTHFSEPRTVHRQVSYLGQVHRASVRLEPAWMMGAATGMRRHWYQHCPATAHWLLPDGVSVGWLLVHGESGAEVEIEGASLQVRVPEPDADYPLRILVKVPGAEPADFGPKLWRLPGMVFQVQSPLPGPSVESVRDARYGEVIDLQWRVPVDAPATEPLLTLTPRPR